MSVRAYIPEINQRDVKKFIDFFHDSSLANTMYVDKMWYLYFHDKKNTFITIHDTDINLKNAKKRALKNKWDLEGTDEYDHIYNKGLPDNTHGVLISIDDGNEETEKIIKMVCYYFGGYYKQSDMIKGKYIYIKKNYGNIVKEVFE